MVGLDEAAARLARRARHAGWRSSSAAPPARSPGWTAPGPDVAAGWPRNSAWPTPVLPWHTNRTRTAELAGALGEAPAWSPRSPATSILLAQNEVGEVTEGTPRRLVGDGRTSATRWPRSAPRPAPRRRPAWSRRCSRRWRTSTSGRPAPGTPSGGRCGSCSCATGSAASWLRDCLEHLQRPPGRDARPTSTGCCAHSAPTRPTSGSAGSLVDRALAARRVRKARLSRTVAAQLHSGRSGRRAGAAAGSVAGHRRRGMWAPQMAAAGAALPGGALRPPRPRRLAGAARPVPAGRPGRRRPRPARPAGVARAHLAGLSLGGMVSMWLAAHAPERVDRLALVCTSARLGPPRGVGATGPPRCAPAAWRRSPTRSSAGGPRPEFAQRHPDVVAGAARRCCSATPPEGYAACCAAIETMDLEPRPGPDHRARPW